MSKTCDQCNREFKSEHGMRVHRSIKHDLIRMEKDRLHRLYWEDGLSMSKIGDKVGVHERTIGRWMDKYGIKRKTKKDYAKYSDKCAWHYYSKQGYEMSASFNPDTKNTDIVKVHRLLAVSEYGFGAVVDNDVHHKNGIPWDNRPDNIEVLNPSDHRRLHKIGESHPNSKLKSDEVVDIKKSLWDGEKSQRDIANEFDVSRGTIADISANNTWTHVTID